ncbi:MAG: transposase family protein [Kiritimatiellaeota bacterium]|nr:transposase family protein [Kiritimatiellota bacterium]
MKAKDIPLPENWPPLIRRAMLHAISLAHVSIICSWSRAADSVIRNARLTAKLDKVLTELARKENQLRLISARLDRVPAKKRPYYTPVERMDILAHKSACGWNLKQTARAFQTDAATISSWMNRVDDDSLVNMPVPWNKYPSYLRYVTKQLKLLVPRLGKKKIAEYFVRSGLYLSATSVGRYLKSKPTGPPKEPDAAKSAENEKELVIKSKHPNHIWTVDLTTVPTSGGFWTSWIPNSMPQCWPFCWWVAVIVDHFSRKAIGFALFRKQPMSEEVTEALDKAVEKAGKPPKHIISDRGKQFDCENYKNWCSGNDIKPRFGAIGKHGSIAITERFIKTLKYECAKLISVPLNFDDMRYELALFFTWYNEYRPHEYLNGRTPSEVCKNSPVLPCDAIARMSDGLSLSNGPPTKMMVFEKGSDIPEMKLELSFLEGRRHLPIIEFKKSA